jgi:hypothetical protein
MITNPQAHDTDPDNSDKIYGPSLVRDEAASKNAYATSVIADAYAVTGLAMSK